MKLVGKVNVLGMTIRVCRSSVDESEGHLETLTEGAHDQAGGRIFLNRDYSVEPSRAREILVHELCHVWFETSGLRNYLQGVCRLNGDAWDDVEENCARLLSPAISSSLPSLWSLVGDLKRFARRLGVSK